jgi:hypothetical protein
MITQFQHYALDKDKTYDTAKEHDLPASHTSAEHLGKNIHDAEHESRKDSVDNSNVEQNYHLELLKTRFNFVADEC